MRHAYAELSAAGRGIVVSAEKDGARERKDHFADEPLAQPTNSRRQRS